MVSRISYVHFGDSNHGDRSTLSNSGPPGGWKPGARDDTSYNGHYVPQGTPRPRLTRRGVRDLVFGLGSDVGSEDDIHPRMVTLEQVESPTPAPEEAPSRPPTSTPPSASTPRTISQRW